MINHRKLTTASVGIQENKGIRRRYTVSNTFSFHNLIILFFDHSENY